MTKEWTNLAIFKSQNLGRYLIQEIAVVTRLSKLDLQKPLQRNSPKTVKVAISRSFVGSSKRRTFGFFQEQFEEIKTFLLPRQLLNQGSMSRTWEKELLQQLCNRSRRTTAGLDLFCHFLQKLITRLLSSKPLNLLREIGDRTVSPITTLSCCRLKNACNKVKQG